MLDSVCNLDSQFIVQDMFRLWNDHANDWLATVIVDPNLLEDQWIPS